MKNILNKGRELVKKLVSFVVILFTFSLFVFALKFEDFSPEQAADWIEERISSYYGKISVIAKEEEKLTEIKKKIKAISTNECFAKYFSILNVEDNGSMYHITISLYPLFEPRSYDQIQTWTDAVCKSSKRILDNYCLVRNISVWAIRPIGYSTVTGNGGLIVYGRTLYEHHTDRYEFKSSKVLKQ